MGLLTVLQKYQDKYDVGLCCVSLCFEAVVLCRCVSLCLVPYGYLFGLAVACEGSARASSKWIHRVHPSDTCGLMPV